MTLKEIIKNWYHNWRRGISKKMFPNDPLTERQQLVFSAFVDGLNDNNCIRFLNCSDRNKDKI